MASETEHYGLTKLAPGEGVHSGGGRFPSADRDVIDELIYRNATHRHRGAAFVQAAPDEPLELSLSTTGGTLPASTTVRYVYTITSGDVGESTESPVASITTPDPLTPPAAPMATVNTLGGALDPGDYYYVLSYWQGESTVETTAVNPVKVIVPAGSDTNVITLTLPTPPAEADGFNVYRRSVGETRYHHIAMLDSDATELVDDGSAILVGAYVTYEGRVAGATNDRTLPSANTTNATNSITVTLPESVAVGEQWSLYRSFTTSFLNSWLVTLDHNDDSYVDIGGGVSLGSPPTPASAAGSPDKVLLTDGAEVQGELPASMVAVNADSAWTKLEGSTLEEALTFIDTEGVGGGGAPFTFVIATSVDSPPDAIAEADAVCDGVDDHEEFEEILRGLTGHNNLPVTFLVAPGTYNFGRAVNLDLTDTLTVTPGAVIVSGFAQAGMYWWSGRGQATIHRSTPGPLFSGGRFLVLRDLILDDSTPLSASSSVSMADAWAYNTNRSPAVYDGEDFITCATGADLAIADADLALSFTNELDVRVLVSVSGYTSIPRTLASKWTTTGNQRSFLFQLVNESLVLSVSSNGSTITGSATSPAGISGFFADGSRVWMRAAWDGSEVQFWVREWTEDEWTPVGTPQAMTSTMFSSSSPLRLLSHTGSTEPYFSTHLFAAEIASVADFDLAGDDESVAFDVYTPNDLESPTKLAVPKKAPYLYMNGGYLTVQGWDGSSLAQTYVSAAADVALDDWQTGGSQTIISQWDTATNQRSVLFQVVNGNLVLSLSQDGTTPVTATSSVDVPFAAGERGWIAFSYTRFAQGFQGANTVMFLTSTDGETWTQLGTTQTLTVTSIYGIYPKVKIGAHSTDSDPLIGKLYGITAGSWALDPLGGQFPRAGSAPGITLIPGSFRFNDATVGRTQISYSSWSWAISGDVEVHANDEWTMVPTSSFHLQGETGASILVDACVVNTHHTPGIVTGGEISVENSCLQARGAPVVESRSSYPMGYVHDNYMYSDAVGVPVFHYKQVADAEFEDVWSYVDFSGNTSDGNDGPNLKVENRHSGFRIHDNIHFFDSFSDIQAYVFDGVQHVDFHNNMIEGQIDIRNSRRVSVAGNHFTYSGLDAITITDSEEMVVRDNLIISPSTATDAETGAILLENVDNSVVESNTVQMREYSNDSAVALIRVTGTSSGNSISRNYLRSDNTMTTGIYVEGTNNSVSDNDAGDLAIINDGTGTYVEAPGDHRRIVKTADQTINAETTPQDDLELTFPVGVSASDEEVYIVSGLLIYSTSVAAGITIDFDGPTAGTFDWMIVGEADNDLDGAGVGVKQMVSFRGTVVATDPATITLQWAQTSSDATDTVVHAGSHVEVTIVR